MSFLAPSSLIAIVASYLLGSLSFAVIVSKALGMDDPRSYGSKNPGATNVLRSGRKGAANNLLGLLVKDEKLKRAEAKDVRGSVYAAA